ncbi:glucose 1-dehydrogenase [Chryseobacterium sp. B21-037]|uniref:SDR family NAD(P)-dependent oxidoreductase n=1 Tax=Chryseobacterium sp. B21-037 TaxID=2926038 RepID=UPI0023592725|nr:glucose 1-dehydrogenase [Chryseobacterium sp. B21-037]MDC8107144.1 glucose 1-dehydrogenase [Chryseobacterium sp. B21-037]WBV56339.1 glucose 1-dehydrogenase [Chryseobacterium daecheongense]
MNRLLGKVAIITGAASGMGAVEAKLIAQEGAQVFLTDINEEKLKAVSQEIITLGGSAAYMVHDVSDEKQWSSVINEVIRLYGKINILVNNAAIIGDIESPLEERSVKEFNKVLNINLTSQFIGMKSVIPFMKKVKGGSIINISSIGGIVGSAGGTGYTASKGGSRLLSKGAAVELAPFNIRVNSVHPGFVDTSMSKNMPNYEAFKKMAVEGTPLRRGGKEEEIAYGVIFLASDESSFVTGTELIIDGGNTAF